MLSKLERDSLMLETWLSKAQRTGLLDPRNDIYVRNRVLQVLGLETFVQKGDSSDKEVLLNSKDLGALTGELVAIAKENGKCKVGEEEACFDLLMDFLTPDPASLQDKMKEIEQLSGDRSKALAYFYQLCQENHYIKKDLLAKNEHFSVKTKYGQMVITINLAKPEKDPKAIAQAAQKAKKAQQAYPAGPLDMANEGFYGYPNGTPRSQLRILPMTLEGKAFGFQFSPYGYFEGHSILMSASMEPMHIDAGTFGQLFSALDQLPGFLVGSNADLPIVGGSILSHHHFQAGVNDLPMRQAADGPALALPFKGVKANFLDWPLTVIRLRGKKPQQVQKAASFILDHWRQYDDPTVGILSHSQGQVHATITPIVFKDEKEPDLYVMDLVLRNNRATEERPYGLFHPREALHHIKKENIGLIEVMGLAILPGRLKAELEQVEAYLRGEANRVAPYHQAWAESLAKQYQQQEVHAFVQRAVGKAFVEVLEDCALFKADAAGLEARERYVTSLLGG